MALAPVFGSIPGRHPGVRHAAGGHSPHLARPSDLEPFRCAALPPLALPVLMLLTAPLAAATAVPGSVWEFRVAALAGAVSGVAVGGGGSVYAAEIVNSRVVKIDPVTGAQSLPAQYGSIVSPRGLAVDGGNLCVCSHANSALARVPLPPGGSSLHSPAYSLSLPCNAAMAPSGPTPAAGTSWGRLKSLYR